MSSRVLLLQSNKDLRSVMSRVLSRAGHAVVAGDDAATGWRWLGRAEFDVLVCNIGLPDDSGWSFMREVRKRYAITGVAVTGYGEPDDIRRSILSGFTEHLVMPVLPIELLGAIERARSPQR